MSAVKRESRPGDTPYNGLKAGGGGFTPKGVPLKGSEEWKGRDFTGSFIWKGDWKSAISVKRPKGANKCISWLWKVCIYRS